MTVSRVSVSQAPLSQRAATFAPPVDLRLSYAELQIVVDERLPLHLQIIGMGSEAARILPIGGVGRVLASFKRSCYVQCEQGVFCIGLASLGEGPLHVLLKTNRDQLPIQIKAGLSVYMEPGLLQGASSQDVRIAHGDSRALYSGKVLCKALSASAVQRLQHVLQHVPQCVLPPSPQGYGWIVKNAHWQAQNESLLMGSDSLNASLREQSYPALLSLSRWLENSLVTYDEPHLNTPALSLDDNGAYVNSSVMASCVIPTDISVLLGAGPGLTPAGDDLLAGVMLALYRVDRIDLAVLVGESIAPFLISRTNTISGAHLRLAARGQCSAPVLELLDCVFENDGVNSSDVAQTAATGIQLKADQIGASSGWDMLAGMSLVLRAL